jgi:hypothetical protein
MGVTKFFVNSRGEFYHGDRLPGDREATQAELVEHAELNRKALAAAQIRALESERLLPRAVREFMLGYMEKTSTPEQLAQMAAYVNLKALDNEIVGLRAIAIGG